MNLFSALVSSLAWIAILGIWCLGWQLLRQNGRILLRLDELEQRLNELEFGEGEEPAGLPPGTEALAFELPDLAGGRRSLARFRGQPVLLIFFNPNCGYCRELMPKLAAVTARGSQREEAHTSNSQPNDRDQSLVTSVATNGDVPGCRPLVIILTTGDAEKNRQFFAEHKVGCPVLLQNDGEVAKAYQVNGTPAGYLVSAEGRISSELAIGAAALLELAEGKAEMDQPADANGDGRADRFSQRSLSKSKLKRDGLKAGTPAPDFRLPRLDGHGELALEELRGRRVLLVFSGPHCGPCNMLAPELEKFYRLHRNNARPPSPRPPPPGEGEPPPALEVVMISRGEPKENRAKIKEHGLTFPVVLQQQWEISRRYAMFSTPVAYLIDEAGIIAKGVAVGVEPILALLKNAGCPAAETERAVR